MPQLGLPDRYSDKSRHPSRPFYAAQQVIAHSWRRITSPLWPDPFKDVTPMGLPAQRLTGFAALARPLPRWAVIVLALAIALALGGAIFAASDRVEGLFYAGVIAGAAAIVVVLATLVRTAAGMSARLNVRRQAQYAGITVVALILAATSGLCLGVQAPLHHAQAATFEKLHQWQAAITQLQLAGERPPSSEAIAAIYDEWGEQLSGTQDYAGAVAKFATVIGVYHAATQAVKRAETDSIIAYLAWGNQDIQQHNYADATRQLDSLRSQSYCQSNDGCVSRVDPLDAKAYYQLAEAQLTIHQYADAVKDFAILSQNFPSSPEAHTIHIDYANALLGLGKQQIAGTNCSSALPTYRQLSSDFADTAAGRNAAAALQAPQPVKGKFATPDTSVQATALLVTNLIIKSNAIQSYTPQALTPISDDGSFLFAPVAQGTYSLLWKVSVNGGQLVKTVTFIAPNSSSAYYVARVGPLCPYDFGTIAEPINPPS